MIKYLTIIVIALLFSLSLGCSTQEEDAGNNAAEGLVAVTVVVDETIAEPASPSAENVVASPTAPSEPDDAYPPPAQQDESQADAAYPSAATPYATSTVSPEDLVPPELPDPNEGKGAIVGQLIHLENQSPGSNLNVYLGTKVEASPGPGYLISTLRNSSPNSQANAGGYFVINDVEPGTYALVIVSLVGSRVLQNPDTGGEYWVDIEAGEVTEVGEVFFDFP